MRRPNGWRCFALVLVLLGCNTSPYRFASVAGRVTLNGEPLVGARIGFQPLNEAEVREPGPGSYATTDSNGYYRLRIVGDGTGWGALVGQHRVVIFKADRPPPDDPDAMVDLSRDVVPARYNSDTELTFDVQPGGHGNADFALTSP